MNSLVSFLALCKPLIPILKALIAVGGRPYIVGGSVRDLVLNRPIKDLDIEVHNISLEDLETILEKFGNVELVGKKFGVLLLLGTNVDWSLPRTDSSGRKPAVSVNPTLSIEQAARRRDLTMNAMLVDLTHVVNTFDDLHAEASCDQWDRQTIVAKLNIIDPYGGLDDIEAHKIRFVDKDLFLEDPLRFFRVMQFIGRFAMHPDEQLDSVCKTISLYDIETNKMIAKERVNDEIKKLFLKSHRPSLGFRWLKKLGRLEEIFPELAALVGVKQRPDYHPEGDVFEHTMQVIDAAAICNAYEKTSNLTVQEVKYMIMLAGLCHDLGKAVTTDEQLKCHGHAEAGVSRAQSLLKRFLDSQFLLKVVPKFVYYHMHPINFLRNHAGLKAYKRLANKLAPELSMQQLALLALADWRGRNKNGSEPLTDQLDDFYRFLSKAEQAKVTHKPEEPVLFGRHVLDIVKPGPQMGELLAQAYELQLEEGITDVDELKKRLRENTK